MALKSPTLWPLVDELKCVVHRFLWYHFILSHLLRRESFGPWSLFTVDRLHIFMCWFCLLFIWSPHCQSEGHDHWDNFDVVFVFHSHIWLVYHGRIIFERITICFKVVVTSGRKKQYQQLPDTLSALSQLRCHSTTPARTNSPTISPSSWSMPPKNLALVTDRLASGRSPT